MLSQARSLPFVPVWETECAFKWLDVAYQERDLGLPSLKTDFLLDSLRTDLRLTELVKRSLGLPPPASSRKKPCGH